MSPAGGPATDRRFELANDLAKGTPAGAVLVLVGYLLMQQVSAIQEDLQDLEEAVKSVQLDVAKRSGDRWTRTDHDEWARKMERQMDALDARLETLEREGKR